MPIKEKKMPNGKWLYKIRPYVKFDDGTSKQTTIHNKAWVGREGYLEASKKENQLKSEIFPVGSVYDKVKQTFVLLKSLEKKKEETEVITLRTLKEMYINSISPQSDPETIEHRITQLNHFCEIDVTGQVDTYPEKDITLFDKTLYQNWQAQMKNKKYKKGKTFRKFTIKYLNEVNGTICRMLDYAVDEEKLLQNFARKCGKIGTPKEIEFSKMKIEYETLDFAEYCRLLYVTRDDLTYNTMFDLWFSRGPRTGEIRAFQVPNHDYKNSRLRVEHTMSKKNILKEPKTASSKDWIYLDSELNEKIHQIILELKKQPNYNDNWFIFGSSKDHSKPISVHAINNNKDKYFKLASINKHLRLHDLRHSCATYLYSIGTPIAVISQILRHKDMSETMKTYIHLFRQDYTKSLDNINKLKQDQLQDQKFFGGEIYSVK